MHLRRVLSARRNERETHVSAAKARTRKASAAKPAATKPSAKAAGSASTSRAGRGTRWTEEQVSLLMESVRRSSTAKEAFETVARELGKSTGTVQQKYYNLLKKRSGGGGTTGKRRGRPPGSSASTAPAARAGAGSARRPAVGSLPGTSELRALTVDDLVGLAQRVKAEVDRRKKELDAAAKLFG